MVSNEQDLKDVATSVSPERDAAAFPQAFDSDPNKNATEFDSGSRPLFDPIGSSGTRIFGGYFSEEYLQKLRGKLGAFVFDEMWRSEPQVAMLLNAVMNPIKAANWEVESADNSDDQATMISKFVDMNLKEQIDWEAFLGESLSMLRTGFSVFEVIHSVVQNHPIFGTFNGLKSLAFRSQKTIERWVLEPNTGKLLGVEQYVYSDVGKNAFLPGQFLVVFTLNKEGDNYEGVSFLRPMYGPWIRKNLYHKLAAIGIERYAIGTPIGTIPKGQLKEDQINEFKKTLQNYTSHECSYITKPEGWEIEIQKGDFDAEEIKEMILLENTEMINAAVANFLALGMSGNSGAFALGTDLSDFFLLGIQSFADLIAGVINRNFIPNFVKLNFGPQIKYPKLKCTGINDKAGKDFAEVVERLVGSEVVRPDQPLEDFMRKRYKMPKPDPTTVREVKPSPQAVKLDPVAPAPQLSERRIKLDESFKQKFNTNKKELKLLMQDGLTEIKNKLLQQIKRKWKSASATAKIKLATQIDAQGVAAYKAELKSKLAEIAYRAIEDAKSDLPRKARAKLSERVKLADVPRGGYWAQLAPKVKANVEAQANLIGDTQVADISKVVAFQYTSSALSTEDVDQVLFDINEAITPVIEGSTATGMNIDAAAANAVANIVNQARMEFFFEPEVLDSIESFTFTNEAPVSDICTELSEGDATWAVGDPRIDEYTPPLHHNCKSRLVPNYKGDDGNPDITGTPPLSKDAVESITLGEPDYRLCGINAPHKH